MIGGGEDCFEDPEIIEKETLKAYARFCHKLRGLEKPGKKAIGDLAESATNVGTSMIACEIVVGAIFRHIKSWRGAKQLCYWYVLDKLCKEHRDTYGHVTSMQVMDIACDYIPWEDAELASKYEVLIQRWEGVFPRHIIDVVLASKKERLNAIAHPEEIRAQREEEEAMWAEEELRHTEVEGLNDFALPCLAYMQGKCTWGKDCPNYHPEGLEGTLPPECRAGDWKCASCGTINRHFRRRCATCPRERPQYRVLRTDDLEERAMIKRDPSNDDVFRRQFGYNPASAIEAVAYWSKRLDNYVEDRIKKGGKGSGAKHWRESAVITPQMDKQEEPQNKRRHVETTVQLPALPMLPPADRIFFVCSKVIERGAHDPDFAGYLFLLCQALPEACRDSQFLNCPPELSKLLLDCILLVFSNWNIAKTQRHPAIPFCLDLQRHLPALPLGSADRVRVGRICDIVADSIKNK